jgi:hypothetical protein
LLCEESNLLGKIGGGVAKGNARSLHWAEFAEKSGNSASVGMTEISLIRVSARFLTGKEKEGKN